MSLTLVISAALVVIVIALLAYMLAQKPVTTAQALIQEHRYAEAVAQPALDSAGHLHRAEALKLLRRFEDALAEYRLSDDPAAREGEALTLAHLGRDLDDAKRIMETTMTAHPAIQEFQALGLGYIELKRGDREAALRLYQDNVELLETRFRDDYTDPDPLLAETLIMYAALAEAAGESARAAELRRRAALWAPGSAFAN